jgi:hypothetical protein
VFSNTSEVGGDGLAVIPGEGGAWVLHNTFVDNEPYTGDGLLLGGSNAPCVVANNLLAGHGVAISVTAGALCLWDYNGFHGNGRAYSLGTPILGNDVFGDPLFVDAGARDYRLSYASPMAGVGVPAGVAVDLAGSVRPAPTGTRPDIGAYEVAQRRQWLPVVSRMGP